MLLSEFTRRSRLVSTAGGTFTASTDGEVIFEVAVPAGSVLAWPFVQMCPDYADVTLSAGIGVWSPPDIGGTETPEGEEASGANPDYQPQTRDIKAMQMRALMQHVQAQSRALSALGANVNALQSVAAGDKFVTLPGALGAPPQIPDPDDQ